MTLHEEIVSILDEGIRPVGPIADEIIAKVEAHFDGERLVWKKRIQEQERAKTIERVLAAVKQQCYVDRWRQPHEWKIKQEHLIKAIRGISNGR